MRRRGRSTRFVEVDCLGIGIEPLYSSSAVPFVLRAPKEAFEVPDGLQLSQTDRDTFACRMGAELLKERLHGSVVDWVIARALLCFVL